MSQSTKKPVPMGLVGTSVKVLPKHLEFLKSENENLSAIVRNLIDRMIEAKAKNSKAS